MGVNHRPADIPHGESAKVVAIARTKLRDRPSRTAAPRSIYPRRFPRNHRAHADGSAATSLNTSATGASTTTPTVARASGPPAVGNRCPTPSATSYDLSAKDSNHLVSSGPVLLSEESAGLLSAGGPGVAYVVDRCAVADSMMRRTRWCSVSSWASVSEIFSFSEHIVHRFLDDSDGVCPRALSMYLSNSSRYEQRSQSAPSGFVWIS